MSSLFFLHELFGAMRSGGMMIGSHVIDGPYFHAFPFWNSLWRMDGDCFGC